MSKTLDEIEYSEIVKDFSKKYDGEKIKYREMREIKDTWREEDVV